MATGILFDLDGTLLDTLDDLYNAVNHTMAQFGCPKRTREEVRRFVGNGVDHLIRLSLPGKADDPDFETVCSAYRSYYNAHAQDKTAPYPGILEALAKLSAEYPIAVVSNKPDVAVKLLCRDYFGPVYALGQRSDIPRKPAPDMIRRAMADLGVDACIYVGDSEVDILAANNASVPCLSVTWGFRDRDTLADAGATHYCDTPADLPRCIRQIAEDLV